MSNQLFGAAPAPIIIADPVEVENYLRRNVGVTLSTLDRCRNSGLADATMTTPNSAATSFGFRFWDGVTRQLRDDLAPNGWTVQCPGSLEVVRRPDNKLQIAAAFGNEQTGDPSPEAIPTPQHPKGAATQLAIEMNQRSFADEALDHAAWQVVSTWWLLYRPIGLMDTRVVAEFSLPILMVGARISGWAVRLILPDTGGMSREGLRLPEPADEVKVDVQRKSG